MQISLRFNYFSAHY